MSVTTRLFFQPSANGIKLVGSFFCQERIYALPLCQVFCKSGGHYNKRLSRRAGILKKNLNRLIKFINLIYY